MASLRREAEGAALDLDEWRRRAESAEAHLLEAEAAREALALALGQTIAPPGHQDSKEDSKEPGAGVAPLKYKKHLLVEAYSLPPH